MSLYKEITHGRLAAAITLVLANSLNTTAWAEDSSIDGHQTVVVVGNPLYNMQPSEKTGGYSVESATVGTKTPAALKDIPQSITVLTNDYINERNFVAVDDLAKNTPGLRTLSNDSGRSSIFSRGYEYDEVNLNGLPAPMQSIYGNLPSLSAVDRVEIMRGPSGLFNSTSELGGVINMVLKRPTEEFSASATTRYGSWNRHYLEADLGGSLNEDRTIRGRFVASNADIKNQVDYNDNDNSSFYGTLEFDLTDHTLLTVYGLHQSKDIVPANGLPAYSDGSLLDIKRSTFIGSSKDYFTSDTNDFGASLQHTFMNGGVLQLSARYMEHDADIEQTFSNGPVDQNGNTGLMFKAQGHQEDNVSLDANYSQMFALFSQQSEFVLGSDYKRYDSSTQVYTDRNIGNINVFDFDPTSVVTPQYDYIKNTNEVQSEVGVYGKVTWRLLDQLAVITGIRASWYQLDIENTALATDVSTDESNRISGKLTPYAGIVYDLTEQHTLYTSYSNVFKPQTAQDSNGKMLESRQGNQWETGIKSSLLNDALNTRMSFYYLKDENIAAQAYDNNGNAITNTYFATGEVETKGVELEVSGYLTDNWMIMAGYTYTDINELSGDHNGTFDTIPKHALSLWTDYHLATWVKGLHIASGMTAYSDYSFTRGDVTIKQAGYAIFDAAIRYDINKNMQASLNVYNLFDNKYYNRVGSTSTFNMYGEPVNVMAGFTYKFN